MKIKISEPVNWTEREKLLRYQIIYWLDIKKERPDEKWSVQNIVDKIITDEKKLMGDD